MVDRRKGRSTGRGLDIHLSLRSGQVDAKLD
jgi:hypothetical protein